MEIKEIKTPKTFTITMSEEEAKELYDAISGDGSDKTQKLFDVLNTIF